MNTSVESLQAEIKILNAQIRKTTSPIDLANMRAKMRELLNALHVKKFKSRQQLVVKKIKDSKKDQPIEEEKIEIRYITKEVPKEIIREVPIEVPKEIIKEVPVYVSTGDGIPDSLNIEEYLSLLNNINNVYIKTNSPFQVNDIVETSDGTGVIKALVIEESEIKKKGGGIFAKVKRLRVTDGKEGERFMGADRRGYNISMLKLLERPVPKPTRKKK